MQVEYQEVEEGRPNVIGTLKGSGGGATLMFCATWTISTTPRKPSSKTIGFMDVDWSI